MKNRTRTMIGMILCIAGLAMSAPYDAAISIQNNYNGWKWDSSVVLTNGIITTAVVPVIGARIMQYDLGTHPFIWTNPKFYGLTFYTMRGFYPDYGGGKMWVAPQSSWNSLYGSWPPSTLLDFCKYSQTIVSRSVDSVSLIVTSPLDTDTMTDCKGLQFRRTMTLYGGSSRMSVKQEVINTAPEPKQWSIWDNTPVLAKHPPADDYSNFWMYYPRTNGLSIDSMGCFVLSGGTGVDSQGIYQIKTNVAPGINGYNYNHKSLKIGSNSDGGWLAFADEAEGFVYVKKFSWVPGVYPDSGSSIQIYSFKDSACMEMEVLGPMTDIAAAGGIATNTIDWFAARAHGPVLAANKAGLITRRLSMGLANTFTGAYGSFYVGRVDLVFDNSAASSKSYAVTPLDSLIINEPIAVPAGATTASLCLFKSNGAFVDTLDKLNLNGIGVTMPLISHRLITMAIAGNRLNLGNLNLQNYSIRMVSLNGSVVWKSEFRAEGKKSINLPVSHSGAYLVSVFAGKRALASIRMVEN